MADNIDYSKLSDEELDAIISGKTAEPTVTGTKTSPKWVVASKEEKPDNTMGMGGVQLGLAGAGGELNELLQGAREKAQLAFLPDNYNEAQDVKNRINAERAERRAVMGKLYSNPEAVAGRFAAQMVPAIAAPARLPAQVGLAATTGFMKPGAEKVTGIGGELSGSAAHGLTDAASMYGVGKGMQLLGKGAGAAMGRYTEEGEKALATKDAAARLGLPPTSLGQLYPHSSMAPIERGAPGMGYSDRTYQQAKTLGREISGEKAGVEQLGSKYVDDLRAAANERLRLASDKYAAVDKYVADEGLQPMSLMYTARTATATNSPGYEGAAALLSDYGFPIAEMAGMKAKDLSSLPVSFVNFHESRIAVNKALNKVNRDVAREGSKATRDLRDTQSYLRDLKTALDSDLERWGKQASGNKEAAKLFNDANAYYRDVAAPTVLDNRLARKAMSKYSGFESPRQALGATQTDLGRPMVDLLVPTMPQRGKDVTTVLQNLPDIRRTLLSQDLAVPVPEGGGLLQASKAVLGHPLTAAEMAISRAPGLRQLSESRAMTRLLGAQNLAEQPGVLPRVGWGAAQYPQDEGTRKLRQLGGVR